MATTTFRGAVRALGGFVGAITGNIAGNVTGNVTGNLTGDSTGAHNGTVGATTPAAGVFTDVTANGNVVLGSDQSDTITINALATIPLAALPEYADQTAASAALSAGRLFRFATTGAIGVALA